MSTKFEITGDNKNLLSALEGAREGVKRTARDIENSGLSIEDMFKRVAAAAGVAFSIGQAKQFAKSVMDVRGQFQQLEIAFSTMLQSEEKAHKLMNQLVETAAKTPFDLKGVSEGAKQLLAYGIAAEDVNETITRLGDIAAGLSIPLGDLVYLYGTTMTQGRMFTMDLRQFMGRGIPMAEELAKQFGVAKNEVAGLVTAGKVSADAVKKAIWSMTEEGSKFGGLMAKQSASITGQISNIEDAIDSMLNDIGKKSEGIINGSLSVASFLVENYETIGKILLQLIATYGAYKAAVMTNIALEKAQAINRLAHIKGVTAMQLVTDILTKKTAALNAVLMANPYVLLATVVMSAVSAYAIFGKSTDEVTLAQKRLNNIKDEAAKKVEEEKDKIEELRKVATSEQYTLKARQDAINQLNSIIPNYNAQLDATTGKYRENKAALDDYLKSLARKYELEGAKDQLRQIGKEIAQTRLEITKAEQGVKGSKNLQSNVGRAAAYNPAESQFLASNTSFAEKELNDANKRLSVKLKERKLIYDTFGEDLMQDANKIAESTPPPVGNGGKGSAKGGKDDSKEVADRAAERVRLEREIAEKTIEAQRAAKESVKAAYIAGIEDEYERERAQEEFEHKKRLADIERKGEEMKKARYEANKKQWELENKDKHYETDSPEGRKGWQGVSLSGEELVSLNAELAKENAEYERAARERAESLVASHQSYTDRKIAIDKQYSEDVKRIDAEIAAAEARGDNDSVAALQRSKRQAATDRAKNQSALSLDILKESPEYIRAFEDLEQTSSETLEYLIEEFEKAKQAAAQSLDPKDLKEYTDTIQRMQDEISSRNPFKTLKKSMEDLRKSEKNMKEAKDRLKLAKQKVKAAKDEGKSIKEIKKAEEEEVEAQKKYNESADDYLKKKKKIKDAGQAAATLFSKIGDAMNQVSSMIPGIGGEIAGIIGDVAGLATSLINALTFTAEGATAAIRAVESASVILAVIGAALQVIQGIMALLGNNDGYENAKAQYDNLVKVWDELIDKKREYLKMSWGNEAKQASEEALRYLKNEEEATRKLAKARTDVTNGSHSMGYRMWQGSYSFDGKNWQDVASEISRHFGGLKFTDMEDMANMTAEQLAWIKGNYSGLWSVMDSDFREHLDNIIQFASTEADILDELKERITGSSFDEVYDGMMDSLYEIANGSEDVMDEIAENWQEMINRMVVNNVLGTKVQEELKKWYDDLYKLQDDYNHNLFGQDAYEQELERLKNSYNDIVTSSQQEIENFRQMGIIKTLEETAEEAKKYFEDILESWKDTLTDLESTTKDWKNTLIDQIFSDLVESAILNAPVTMGEKTFDNFEAYLTDWTERYKSLIEDTTLSDEERNERLKVLIDEQTALREQQAEKAKQLAEGIGKDMSEAFSNSLDNLGDSLIEGLLANSEADAENAGKQIALSMIKEMLQTMLASEKYAGRMEEIRKKWQQLLSGEDVSFTMDDVLQDITNLNNDIANDESISALAQQYKELNKQVENTQTVFNDLHNTFLNTLTDMKGDAESFRKTLEQTMLKDFIDKHVLDVPITVNGMDFEDFNAYVEDWNSRYAEEVKAGNIEAVDALLDELVQVRELTLSQAEDLRKRLEESMHELGSGFSNLRDTFVKTLTNIVGDAESLGKEIGQTMMEQMLNAFVEKQYSDRINAVNEEWAMALESGDPDKIDEIRQKVISLYETISSDRVVKQLADDIKDLTDTGTPFDNLRSSYLSAVTDMKKSTKDFTQEISKMIAESFVDSFVLGGMFDDKIEEWKKKYRDITTDAGLSEEERMKQLRGLSEMIAAEREGMQGQVSEIYRLLGISDQQDQQATMSLAEAATYDQFELYLGIATAQQIALEQGNSVRQQILSTLQTMGQITSPTNPTLLEMRNMFSTANEYLLDIKLSNRKILDSFSVQLESINAKLRKL